MMPYIFVVGHQYLGATWGIKLRGNSNIGTKCNSLTQRFIGISTAIDTWATCFDSYRVIFRPSKNIDPMVYLQQQIHGLHVSTPIESSSGPQIIQIQLARQSSALWDPQCLQTSYCNNMESYIDIYDTILLHIYIYISTMLTNQLL